MTSLGWIRAPPNFEMISMAWCKICTSPMHWIYCGRTPSHWKGDYYIQSSNFTVSKDPIEPLFTYWPETRPTCPDSKAHKPHTGQWHFLSGQVIVKSVSLGEPQLPPFLYPSSFKLRFYPSAYLSSYPGFFQEPHWSAMGLLEISRVTWQESSSSTMNLGTVLLTHWDLTKMAVILFRPQWVNFQQIATSEHESCQYWYHSDSKVTQIWRAYRAFSPQLSKQLSSNIHCFTSYFFVTI